MNRRQLFKGVVAVIGATVAAPIVKALVKEEPFAKLRGVDVEMLDPLKASFGYQVAKAFDIPVLTTPDINAPCASLDDLVCVGKSKVYLNGQYVGESAGYTLSYKPLRNLQVSDQLEIVDAAKGIVRLKYER